MSSVHNASHSVIVRAIARSKPIAISGDCFVALWAPHNDGLCSLYKINRPSHLRWAIWFDFFICLLAKLRPTIHPIVVVIIIVIIGEAELVYHDGGIIAQISRSLSFLKAHRKLGT
jgi:hypothetical protein